MYNHRYSHFYSTGQVFQPFVFQRANISGKLNFLSFLNLSVKEQYFNKFRKLVRSTCLHFHFDSLSQTFDRRDIHLSQSVLQMCNNGSYRLKIIAGCYLSVLWKVWLTESNLKYTHVLLTNLWTCWSTALLDQDLRKKEH